ncbi:MAG: class I SAM-dependent methyltransferase [Leptolyngbyaceae cyanobacterium bins.302]|nr:class I SAM-dependent methyltransferase [Leptolyngbyaceae cyanobacterium bins.302]
MPKVKPIKLRLPPKGALVPNNSDDPLKYYYVPFVGGLYINRINIALGLLQGHYFENVLEIGYGSGVLMPTLCQMSKEVHGVDLGSDPHAIGQRLANLGCYPKLSPGEPDHLLFDDNSFDLIVTISVLEHIKQIAPFLKEIHRVLKPGGQLLVGMPAVNKTMGYLFQAIGFPGIDEHHVTSPEEMAAAARPIFELQSVAKLPSFLPGNIYLYKAFCFRKP